MRRKHSAVLPARPAPPAPARLAGNPGPHRSGRRREDWSRRGCPGRRGANLPGRLRVPLLDRTPRRSSVSGGAGTTPRSAAWLLAGNKHL